MVPVRIAVSGFLSYRHPAEITLDGTRLWMLCGRNGAGKSALFDAITFALYGSGRYGERAVQAYIHHEASEMVVEFDFDLNGRRFRVKRTASRTKPSSFLALEVDRTTGEERGIMASTERGLKEWVERTLNLDLNTFIAAVLLRQGDSERLLSTTGTTRGEMMARIVDLRAYERLHDAVNTEANRLDGGNRPQNGELARLRREAARLEGEIKEQVKASITRFALDSDTFPTQETWRETASRLLGRLEGLRGEAETKVTCLNTLLFALTSIQTTLDGWRGRLSARADLLWKRTAYDSILSRAAKIEQNAARLEELTLAEPQLKDWHETRLKWRKANSRHAEAVAAIQGIEAQLRRLSEEQATTQSELTEAERKFQEAVVVLERAKVSLRTLEARLRQLRDVEGKPECSVCGQPLTPEHVPNEIEVVERTIEAEKAKLAGAISHKKVAEQAVAATKAKVQNLQVQTKAVNKALSDNERYRDLAEQDRSTREANAARVLEMLQRIARDLSRRAVSGDAYTPEPFISRLCGDADAALRDCLLLGNYPTAEELEIIASERTGLAGAEAEASELSDVGHAAGQLDAQIQSYDAQLSSDAKALDDALHGDELAILYQAKSIAEQAVAAEQAAFISLAGITDPDERNREAEAALKRIDSAAGQPAKVARQEIQRVQTARDRAAAQSEDARSQGDKLGRLLTQWDETNCESQETARLARAYRALATKLDRTHLQSYLRATAETAIVAHADTILQRLSDGTLHLRLQKGSSDPLDLRVVDREKGGREILPAGLSGSQRFRVCVALALGIGEYACGTREGGVKSVIVDEGFGSLDREGREKMIEELHNLGRVLERIIVVSHQEEFETAFPHRWRISLRDGSAQADLVV